MRVWILLALLIPLAGCADDAGPTTVEDDDTFDGVETHATATTGVIRGVVVDESIQPIVGAMVSLVGSDLNTTTNENGAFAFNELEPGSYFVEASRLGFVAMQKDTTVVAGVDTPEVLKFVLLRDEGLRIDFTPYDWKGFMQCGLSVIALCGVADDYLDDDFVETHVVDPDPAWIQSEMIWESTQAVSDEMWLWHSYSTKGGGFDDSFGWVQGPSPLLIKTHAESLNRWGTNESWAAMGSTHDLTLRVFSGSINGTRDPSGCYPRVDVPAYGRVEYCGGVGFTLQQDFHVYTHMFYGFQPDDGWRFSVHGHPVVPEP